LICINLMTKKMLNTLRLRRYKERNPEKYAADIRAWHKANPESTHAAHLKWYTANVEQVNAANLKWRVANPEKASSAIRAWKRANPDKKQAYEHKRRTRMTGAGGSYTVEQFKALGNLCLRCGCTGLRLTPDHVLPVALGGSSDISNIQPLCGPCNSRKGAKHIDYRRINESA
jgi:5-methylcytosine-specific restriction endonuclease McrA